MLIRLQTFVQRQGIFHNWFAKLSALLIAIALWFVATAERRTTATRSLDVPLEIRGLNENRVLNDLPKKIQISIQGARGEIEQIEPSNLEASISVSNLEDGFFSQDVRIDAPQSVKVLRFEPKRVSATLKSVVRQNVLVRIAALDNIPVLPASFSVTAIGTSEQVGRVVFALGLSGNSETGLTPVDRNGQLVEGVKLEPDRISLR